MAGYTVNLSTVAGIAREFSQTDSNGLTNQKVFDFANTSMLKMRKLLIERGIDAASLQETLGTITDAVGEYAYPTDYWLPKSMEINWFDTTSSQLYVPVEKIDNANLPKGVTVGWLRKNQSFNSPVIDFRGDNFEIFPTPLFSTWGGTAGGTLASAIRFFYYLQPTLYTDNTGLTDSLSYPESIDYHSFARIISAHYDFSIGRIGEKDLEEIVKLEVERLIQVIQGDGKMVTKTKSLPLYGWEY